MDPAHLYLETFLKRERGKPLEQQFPESELFKNWIKAKDSPKMHIHKFSHTISEGPESPLRSRLHVKNVCLNSEVTKRNTITESFHGQGTL